MPELFVNLSLQYDHWDNSLIRWLNWGFGHSLSKIQWSSLLYCRFTWQKQLLWAFDSLGVLHALWWCTLCESRGIGFGWDLKPRILAWVMLQVSTMNLWTMRLRGVKCKWSGKQPCSAEWSQAKVQTEPHLDNNPVEMKSDLHGPRLFPIRFRPKTASSAMPRGAGLRLNHSPKWDIKCPHS